MAVAQHGDVGQQQGAILAEALGIEAVLVHKVKSEAAAQQRIVDALRRLVHVLARARRVRAGVEKLRALAHDNADVGDGAAVLQMRVMFARSSGSSLLPTFCQRRSSPSPASEPMKWK